MRSPWCVAPARLRLGVVWTGHAAKRLSNVSNGVGATCSHALRRPLDPAPHLDAALGCADAPDRILGNDAVGRRVQRGHVF